MKALGLLCVFAVTVAACSGDDDGTTATGSTAAGTTQAAATASEAPPTAVTPAPSTTAAPTSAAPATAAPTEPTGVPGATSPSDLCRDYSRVVGTRQVLTIAGTFDQLDAEQLARLELISAPVVITAADAVLAEWPSELESERDLVSTEVLAPIRQRAEAANTAAVAAGIAAADHFITAWTDVLATYQPDSPAVSVPPLDEELEGALQAAATGYAATAVPYHLDVTLFGTADIPLTTDYLFRNCPELTYLISGDAD